MKTKVVLQIGALGFAVSTVMFFAILVILSPFDFADPVDEILAGQVDPATDIFRQYMTILPTYYAIDNVFIVGWVVGWVGVTVLVGKRNRVLGSIILVLGMAGPLLDFLENEISWTVISVYEPVARVPLDWYVGWRIIRQLSYIFPYCVAALVGISIWSERTLDRVTTGVGMIGVVALVGMYIPVLWVGSHLWWPIWFVTLSLLLWRRGKDLSVEEMGG